MEYLLNPRNIRILESFCLVKTLFAFDYDGTLAPIASDPKKAVMNQNVSNLLKDLNRNSHVAIITGRKTSDVMTLLPIDPFIVIGNHGAEGMHSEEEILKLKSCCQNWLKGLSPLMEIIEGLGITLENKEFSLSFHFRNAPDPIVAEKSLGMILSGFDDARITNGKFVMNLIPEFALDKGMALERIMKKHHFKFGVYFGDDHTDEDVFRYQNPKLLTVKVGVEETLAKYYLKDQDEMEEVLQIIKAFRLNSELT